MTISAINPQFGVGGAYLAAAGGAGKPDLPTVVGELQLHAVKRLSLTILEADLTAGATTQSFNLGAALPAGSMVMGASVLVATAFTGGGATDCKVAIGSAGDDDAILASADVDVATDGRASTWTPGIAPNAFFAASTQLTVKVTSAGGNVTVFTAGAMTIDVLYTEATP